MAEEIHPETVEEGQELQVRFTDVIDDCQKTINGTVDKVNPSKYGLIVTIDPDSDDYLIPVTHTNNASQAPYVRGGNADYYISVTVEE